MSRALQPTWLTVLALRPAATAGNAPDRLTDGVAARRARPVGTSPRQLLQLAGCQLTTPHKLQGGGSFDKPTPGVIQSSLGRRKATAAPCQLHAVVRRHSRRRSPGGYDTARNTAYRAVKSRGRPTSIVLEASQPKRSLSRRYAERASGVVGGSVLGVPA